MDKYSVDPKQEIICPHCGAKNPLRAYCCLSCFKVMFAKPKVPLWQLYVRPSMGFWLVFLLLIGGGIFYFKRWIEKIDAEITLNLKAADYSVSVVAEKNKKVQESNLETPSN
ncbi:MAG: hypothetical protein ACKVQC_06635 [Elusimicrobiota bacterium]